jgi:hypothetical protein
LIQLRNYFTSATEKNIFTFKLQKGCTRLAPTSDKVYQLLAHCLWFSPGTPASSTTKTGGNDIAEILLKVALKHTNKQKIYPHRIGDRLV